MNDIKCPHCGKIFKVDGAGFANILKQVRDSQFEKEIHDRLENAEREKQDAVKLAEADIRNKARDVIAKKDLEISSCCISVSFVHTCISWQNLACQMN